jgi:hypothetical protein
MRLKPKLVFFAIIFLIVDLQQAYSDFLQVPSFLATTPAGHFAGVSAPCPSLSEARKSATLDVVRQVLGSIGTSYGYMEKHHVKGNARDVGIQRNIEESLSGNAKGIVIGVEKNIVKSHWSIEDSGRFVYFILVQYPEEKILEMRRLSRGARLIATGVLNVDANGINLKVSEVNGVSVRLTSAVIIIRQYNRFAKPISLFIWKVPSIIEHRSSLPLDPVKICENSANIQIPTDTFRKSLIDHLLGANIETIVTLNGYDEIGRPVSVNIETVILR